MRGMKKGFLKTLGAVSLALVGLGLVSCDGFFTVGLGNSVDTREPSVEITYPPKPTDTSEKVVIRDQFVLAGTIDDDIGVTKVTIKMVGGPDNNTVVDKAAEISSDKKTWSITLNSFKNGEWEFKDGEYEVTAIAEDKSGRSKTKERSFTIDNTAPVLILQSPLSAGSADSESVASYGRVLKLVGDVSDANKKYLDFYFAEDNSVNHDGSSLGEVKAIEGFNLNAGMSSDAPLVIAKYISADSTDELNKNYFNLFGAVNADKNDTKYYRMGVVLYDNAKVYQNPNEDPADNKSEGNKSEKYYLRTEEYIKFLNNTPGMKDFSASNLMQILNGTYRGTDYADKACQEAVLAELGKDGNFISFAKNEDVSALSTTFTVNPDNAPFWSVDSYNIDLTTTDTNYKNGYRSYTKGNPISLTLIPNTDKDEVNPRTIKLEYCEVGTEDWKVAIDKGDWNENVSKTSTTHSFVIEDIVGAKFYKFRLTGEDTAGNDYSPVDGKEYGFWSYESADAPVVKISSVQKDEYYNSEIETGRTVSGTVTCAGTLESVYAKLEITKIDGTVVSKPDVSLVRDSSNKSKWSVEIPKKTLEKDGRYKYILTVTGVNSQNISGEAVCEFVVVVDRTAPVLATVEVEKQKLYENKSLPFAGMFDNTSPEAVVTYIEETSGIRNIYCVVNGVAKKAVLDDEDSKKASLTLNGLKEGLNTVYFYAEDAAGNRSKNSEEFTLKVNLGSPVISINPLKNTSIYGTELIANGYTFSGKVSTSSKKLSEKEPLVATLKVTDKDGKEVSLVKGEEVLSAKVDLKSDGTWTYTIPAGYTIKGDGKYKVELALVAKNSAEVACDAEKVSFDVLIDTTAPSFVKAEIEGRAINYEYLFKSKALKVTAVYDDGEGSGVAKVTAFLNGKATGTDLIRTVVDGTVVYSSYVDGFVEGENTIYFVAEDNVGIKSEKTPDMKLKVTLTAPVVKAKKLEKDSYYHHEIENGITLEGEVQNAVSISAELSVVEDSGAEVLWNAEKAPTVTAVKADDKWTLAVPTTALKNDGNYTYTITVKAVNAAGVESDEETVKLFVVVDRTAPALNAFAVAKGSENISLFGKSAEPSKAGAWFTSDTLKVSGAYAEVGSKTTDVKYWLKSTKTAPAASEKETGSFVSKADCSFNGSIEGFEEGANYLYFQTSDNAGNVSAVSAPILVQVDLGKPTVTMDSIDVKEYKAGNSITFNGTMVSNSKKFGGYGKAEKEFTIVVSEGRDGKGTVVYSNADGKDYSENWTVLPTVTGPNKTGDAWRATVNLGTPKVEGAYTVKVSFVAYNAAGTSSEVKTATYYLDSKVPAITEIAVGGKTFLGTGAVEQTATWFKDEALRLNGTISENESGIEKITYSLKAEGKDEVKDIIYAKDGKFDTSISGFEEGVNELKFTVEDKAGNVSEVYGPYTVQVDKTAPKYETSKVKFGDAAELDAAGTILTNGKSVLKITGTWSDNKSNSVNVALKLGDASLVTYKDAATKEPGISFGEVSKDKNGSSGTWSAYVKSDDYKNGGAVSVTVTDLAGNKVTNQNFILSVDKEGAEITVDAFTGSVNGKVTFSGTAADYHSAASKTNKTIDGKLSTVKVYYIVTDETETSAPKTTDTRWVQFDSTDVISTSDSKYNWSVEHELSSATKLVKMATDKVDLADDAETEKAVVYVKAVAVDAALNETVSAVQKVVIDRNADRPVIQITSLESDSAWLKSDKINCVISDDDGTIDSVKIVTGKGTINCVVANGSFTIELPNSTYTDGTYNLSFEMKDKAGTTFKTAETGKFNRPYVKFGEEDKVDNTTAVVINKDTNVPKVKKALVTVNADAKKLAEVAEAADLSAQTFVGNNKYLKFYLPVLEQNVASVSFEVRNENDKDETSKWGEEVSLKVTENTVEFDDDTYTYYESEAIACSTENIQEVKTVYFKVTDQAGNVTERSFPLSLDNVGPSISVSTPKSDEVVTGDITIRGGDTNDGNGGSGIKEIRWYIPTNGNESSENQLGDKFDESKVELNGKVNGTTAWSLDLVNDLRLTNYISEDLGSSKAGAPTESKYCKRIEGTNFWSVPVYFVIEDNVGNKTVKKDFALRYNPDGDKPVAAISYPENKSGEVASVGGKFIINGSAKDNEEVDSVYVQFAFASSGEALKTAKYDKKTFYNGIDYENLIASIKSVYTEAEVDTTNAPTSDWWGIKVNGRSAWNLEINIDGELNSKYFKVRACAVDNNGKFGEWSNETSFFVDAGAPIISTPCIVEVPVSAVKPIEDFNVDSTTKAMTYTPAAQKKIPYTPDMYVSGLKYLQTEITDDGSIKSIVVQDVNNKNKELYNLSNLKTTYGYASEYDDHSGKKGWALRIPVSTAEGSGNKTYKIIVEDNDGKKNTLTVSVNCDNDAPAMQEILGGAGKPVAQTKVRNSNNVSTFQGEFVESGSMFNTLALFFTRTVDGKDYVELPLPEMVSTNNEWKKGAAVKYEIASSKETTADGKNAKAYLDEGVYGIAVTGGTREASTFTSSAVSELKYIAKGGLIRLGGVDHKIEEVNGTKVTFTGTADESITEAFFPVAFFVDHLSDGASGEAAVWTGSKVTITGDDGDGLIESVRKTGSTYKWEASVFADELEDGVVTVHARAYDNAGNASEETSDVMITNKTPRLSKVWIATDLNGDNKFTKNEAGTTGLNEAGSSTIVEEGSIRTERYYSAINNGTLQDVVTIGTTNKTAGDDRSGKYTGLTMVDKLGVAVEFVGTYEGFGAGSGAMNYVVEIGTAAVTAPSTTTEMTGTLGRVSALDEVVEGTSDNGNIRGFILQNSTVTNSDAYKTAANKMENGFANIAVTLWDSTSGTTPGVADKVADASKNTYETFGAQWTVLNIPVKIDLVDNEKPTVSFNEPVASNAGHVHESNVSGTVTFTGSIRENKRVTSLKLTSNKKFGETDANKTVVVGAYNTTKGALTVDGKSAKDTYSKNVADGVTFEVTKQEFTLEKGHEIEYVITVDTEKVDGIASKDVKFTLEVEDGTAANKQSPEQTVNIVPFITSIKRTETTKSDIEKTNRSSMGAYDVAIGDTLTVTGYNLPTGATATTDTTTFVKVNETKVVTSVVNEKEGRQFTVAVPNNSGELIVTVNGVPSLNYKHDASYSTELSVWDVGHYFKSSDDEVMQTFAMDNSGNMFSTWSNETSSTVQMERGLNNDSKPIYVCFDQAGTETGINVDKNVSNGKVSAIYFPKNVGWSGTPDTTGYSHHEVTGGVWGVGINNDMGNVSYGNFENPANANDTVRKYVRIAGNAFTLLDSKIISAGYPLASDSMRRKVSKFKTGRTVMSNGNMHFIYYDEVNHALRYTFQAMGADNYNSTGYANKNEWTRDIVGWILVDGKTDGQDRIHTKDSRNTVVNGNDSSNGIYSAMTETTVTLNKALEGSFTTCTFGVSYTNSSGKYMFDIHEARVENGRQTLTVTDGTKIKATINGTNKCTGGAVYYGDKVLVANGTDNTRRAGLYSALDVTSSGKPVIVYFDETNQTLRIAYSSSAAPTMNAVSTGSGTFSRQSLSGTVKGGTYVQAKIDPTNHLHIVYRGTDGKLYYLRSTNAPDGDAAYTFGDKIEVGTGTHATISFIGADTYNATSQATGSYTPCISYMAGEASADAVMYAVLVDNAFDVHTVPGVKDAADTHYATGGNFAYVEGNRWNAWSVTDDNVNTANCQAAVAFNTGRMDVVFLKKE